MVTPDPLRAAEVISGVGQGGAEVALLRRLRHSPDAMETFIYNTRPNLDELELRIPDRARLVHVQRRLAGRALWRRLRSDGAQVVVVHNPIEACVLLASKRKTDPPLVVVAHLDVTSPNRIVAPILNLLMRLLNHRANLHIAVSADAAEGRQCRGARATAVQPLGAEVDRQAAPQDLWSRGTRIRLLFVGRFVAQKNLDGLLRAIARIAKTLRVAAAEVVCVGAGPAHKQLTQLAHQLDVEDLIRIYEPLADPSGVYAVADWFIVSSHNEGGPLTLLEAMLSGCRVLSTPVGLAPIALEGDEWCVLLPGGSDDHLATGLERVATLGALSATERSQRAADSMRWNAVEASREFYRLVQSVRTAS